MRTVAVFVLLAGIVFAQVPATPTFEVASVKTNAQYQQDDPRTWKEKVDTSPGSLTMHNVSMITILKWAYHVSRYQIVAPSWLEVRSRGEAAIDTNRYDVLAKAAGPATIEEMRPMLQALLAERFRLGLHRETRTIPVYALVEAKGGHKMRRSQVEGTPETREDAQGASTRGVTMADLANDLCDARDFRAAVIDGTGLQGRFDFEINMRKYVPQLKPGDPPPDVLAIVQEALQGELGLKLESRRAAVEMLVIDRLERTPTEN